MLPWRLKAGADFAGTYGAAGSRALSKTQPQAEFFSSVLALLPLSCSPALLLTIGLAFLSYCEKPNEKRKARPGAAAKGCPYRGDPVTVPKLE
jgi:hypothetical protein